MRTAADQYTNRIGDKLRARRKQLRLTIAALAKASATDAGMISRTENGVTAITITQAIRLAAALGINLSNLLANDVTADAYVPRDRNDLSLHLAIIATDTAFWRMVDRNDKTVIQRLQIETPQRLRLLDLKRVGDLLDIDLIDFFWRQR